MYENLKALRKEKGMSQAQFAESIHIPTNTYSNYEKRVREPDSDFWIAVAEKYNVSIDYLMGFTDDPKRSKYATPSKLDQKYAALDDYGRRIVDLVIEAETDRVRAQAAQIETTVIDLGTIRRYLYGAAAGPDGMSVNDYEDIPRTEDMPRGADYCISVSGDSMEPYLYEGQTVYVCRDRKVDIGEVGVWTYHDGTYIKQYDRRKDGVYLLSANPDRESLNVRIANEALNELHYQGKVLGIKKMPLPVYR